MGILCWRSVKTEIWRNMINFLLSFLFILLFTNPVSARSYNYEDLSLEDNNIVSVGDIKLDTITPNKSNEITIKDDTFIVETAKTPTGSSDTGTTGMISWDTDYLYICVSSNSWKRAALSTWGLSKILMTDGVSRILLTDGSSFLLRMN